MIFDGSLPADVTRSFVQPDRRPLRAGRLRDPSGHGRGARAADAVRPSLWLRGGVRAARPAGPPAGLWQNPRQMRLFALRGATSVESNTADAILSATAELMRELMARNELEPERMVSCIFTRHRGPRRRVPRRRGAQHRAQRGAADVRARGARPRLAAARDPRPGPLLRPRGAPPAARVPARGTRAQGRPRVGTIGAVPIEFAQRISRIPSYPVASGYDLGADVAMLASNESCFAPLPEVVEAAQAVLGGTHRYPDPSYAPLREALSRALRRARRAGSRSATAPATSCWPPARRCSSPGRRSSTPGRRSASIRTWRRRPARARSRFRSTPRTATTSTRSPSEITVATRLVLVCNPNNPTSTALGARPGRGVPGARAAARVRDPRRGLRRVLAADRRPVRVAGAAAPPPQPGAAADLLEGLRARGAARRLRAVRLGGLPDRRRPGAPAVLPGRSPPRPRRSRRSATRTRSSGASRTRSPRGWRSRRRSGRSGCGSPSRTRTSSGCVCPRAPSSATCSTGSPPVGVLVRAGASLGREGALRVTVGTAAGERAVRGGARRARRLAGLGLSVLDLWP